MTKAPRPIRIEGDIAYVPLTKGYEAIIDAADVPLVAGLHWHACVRRKSSGEVKTVYAGSKPDGKKYVHMHRVINSTPDGFETDHVDGNGLNNRRGNLRRATTQQNQANATVRSDSITLAKGVYWDATRECYAAQVHIAGKNRHLGRFRSLEDATAVAALARLEAFASFARTA